MKNSTMKRCIILVIALFNFLIMALPASAKNGNKNTFKILESAADIGWSVINLSGCLKDSSLTGLNKSMQILTCEEKMKLSGIRGNFQCATCSGDYGYEMWDFKSQGGVLVSGTIQHSAGYIIDYSSSILTVTHKSLGYKVSYRIDGLNGLDIPFTKSAKLSIIEIVTPNTINQATQYIKKAKGNNVSLNYTYQVIDEIWKEYEALKIGNALDFAANIISDPNYLNAAINDYYANKLFEYPMLW